MTIIIALTGWRGYTYGPDITWIEYELYRWSAILTRDAKIKCHWRVGDEPDGFDAVAYRWLKSMGEDHTRYLANWNLPNGAGGPVRSRNMLQGRSYLDPYEGINADVLLAFPKPDRNLPDQNSPGGTWRCIELAKRFSIPFIVPGRVKKEPEGLF